MPGGLEFETEYANEAEEAVQLMQFDPGDGINPRTGEMEPEMELKMTVMNIYNDRLTQKSAYCHCNDITAMEIMNQS
jgi:transcriptional adapter 2-alpha